MICKMERRPPPRITIADRCDTFAAAVGYLTITLGILAGIFAIVFYTHTRS